MSNHLPKTIIFGSGSLAKKIIPSIKNEFQLVAVLDNDPNKWGSTFEGLPILNPEAVTQTEYDTITIASQPGINPIVEQLLNMGVMRGNINTDYVVLPEKSRILFLERIGDLFLEGNTQGCVAEGGVFQGEFAKEINRIFPTKKLFLFDTFSGFDFRDTEIERKQQYSESDAGHLCITSEELVMNKMPFPSMCILRKGYFPETTDGIDETFCFVNLDFDLFQPTLAGLEYFFPRMVKNGIILVHDYFSESYKGVKEAVEAFNRKQSLRLFPIGDGISIGIYC